MAIPPPLPSVLSPPSSELTSISQLLHLTHHRNKNQHRLAGWWKLFSQLRRQVGKLLVEVAAWERCVKFSSSAPAPALGGKNLKLKKKDKRGGEGVREGESRYVRAARETVEERVEFLESWVLPKCFLSFSNVVADNQYAALGLMLMGTLARVQTILRGLGRESGSGDGDGEEETADDEKDITGAENLGNARETDLGEVVSREAVLEIEAEDDGVRIKKSKKTKRRERAEGEEEFAAGGEGPPVKRPKKRKKGDAFDDLFAGLI